MAEDSILLTQMIRSALVKAGYVNLNMYPNGGELWDALQQWKGAPDLREHVALIITDLEMPQMDGHRLTKLIKCDPEFSRIPVVIFSSLITEEMRRKGKEVGADEQLSKPEIGHLIGIIDQLIAPWRVTEAGGKSMNSKYIVRQPTRMQKTGSSAMRSSTMVRIRHSAGEMVMAPAISPQQTPSTIS